jgi:PAS domain S-box-containing protein
MSVEIRDRILDCIIEGENAPIIFCLDEKYRYLFFNDKHRAEMRKVWKREIEEGDSILELMSVPELRAAAKASFDRVIAGEDFREVHEQGEEGPCYEFQWTPVRGERGEVLAILARVHDITEKRATEQRLRDTESRYMRLYESMSEAFARVDMSGRLVEFNEAYRAMLGYEKEELLSRSYQELTPDAWHGFESKIVEDQVLARGHSDVYEKEYICKDGSLMPVELRTFLLRDSEGRGCGMWAIVRDISERKRAERRLIECNEALEFRVAERTSQYKVANEEMKAFAYAVSHDLKAPLRAISGFSAVLVEEYGPKLDDEGLRLLGIVRENAMTMERLIAVILEFSRVGRFELNISRIDMSAMARSMFFEVASPKEREAITLDIGELPEAEGDPVMLRLVWAKLLSNAVKFTARSAKREIRVYSEESEGGVSYLVSDTGAGFDMAYVGKLFKVFQRLHSTADYEGSGVGLAIVKRIVERHGGRVGAEGRIGEGATFRFWLPARPRGAEGGST